MKNECTMCGVTSLPVYSWAHGDAFCGACLLSRTAEFEVDARRYRYLRDTLAVEAGKLATFVADEAMDSSTAEAIDASVDARLSDLGEKVGRS